MRASVRAALVMVCVLAATACNGTATDTDSDGTETATTAATTTETDSAGELDEDALSRVTDAAESTVDEGTVRFETTIESEGTPGDDGEQPLAAEGEEDFDAEQRRLTFSGPGGELEIIVDGTDVYVEVPGTEDATWARVELDALVEGDVGFGGPAGLPFRSSAVNLTVLEDAVTQASEAGEEDVRGETATRYDLVVDLEQAGEQAAEGGDTWSAVAEQSGVTEMDMQVWIGDDDLIHRVAYSIDLSQADVEAATEGAEVEAQPQGVVTVTVEYFDFGADVAIELPSDDDIVDMDEQEIRDSMQGTDLEDDDATEESS